MFKAYSQRNEKMGDILIASNVWFFILLRLAGILTSDFDEYDADIDTAIKISLIFSNPFLYINLFLFGGILAKTYFSKYYGNIILKIGIVILFLVAYVLYPVKSFYMANQFDDMSLFVFYRITFYIGAIINILFFVPYFKLISNTNINVSITSKNDPKDW